MTTQESQNIEWKESWRDEYIKWICGFANAKGGILVIGKNDQGVVTGITDAKQLMNDLPNKIRDVLGIIVDVDLKTDNSKEYLEITVEPYPHPVSYKGVYHYRSGSTKQELKGAALDRFLLKKLGKTWDSVPYPYLANKDLNNDSFEYFRKKASKSGRVSEDVLTSKNEELLDNLQLIDEKYLKRAAVLLFHSNPEKFFSGAFIKIGYFESDTELRFQDEIHGNLFEQVEKAMESLFIKHLKAYISYEGITRVERYVFPVEAIREALLNAVAHKDYSSNVPIQIRVYEDKIIFLNDGHLPENWTVEKLKQIHSSKPFNPFVANAFFRAGLIEAWGRGTLTIIDECRQYGCPNPIFTYDLPDFMLEIKANQAINTLKSPPPDKNEKVSEKTSEKTSEKILKLIAENPEITIAELTTKIGITDRSIERNIQKLQKEKKLKRLGIKGGKWQIIK